MIIKKRTKPRVLQKLEAVIQRLSPQFPKLAELQGKLSRRYKGYIGEQKVDYHLDQFAHKYTILLQGICLELQGKNFEIDTIVIIQQAIYCIECKNYNGTIIFDTICNQFTRSEGKTETGFRYPITQAENHQFQLTQWFHERHHHIPVYFLIAISDPRTGSLSRDNEPVPLSRPFIKFSHWFGNVYVETQWNGGNCFGGG